MRQDRTGPRRNEMKADKTDKPITMREKTKQYKNSDTGESNRGINARK